MINFSHIKKTAVSFFAMSALCLTMTGQAQAVPVDLELSLVIDVSGSVSPTEYDLQADGYGAAFKDGAVHSAITSGLWGRIAVNVVQFGTSASEVIGWTLLDSVGSSNAFGTMLENMLRVESGQTDIAEGIDVARLSLLSNNNFESSNLVMDVSGDGQDNSGGSVITARNTAVGNGITINGLPIGGASLATYYTNNVIGGPGSFIVGSPTFNDFQEAIEQKLVTEITGGQVPEPSTIILLGSGLVGLVAWRRKKQG